MSGAAPVHPPLNERVTYGTRAANCPACGAAVLANTGCDMTCNRCDTRMHAECYWGRVATLAEWQDYIRNVNGGPEDFTPTVICARCRAKGRTVPPADPPRRVIPFRPRGTPA